MVNKQLVTTEDLENMALKFGAIVTAQNVKIDQLQNKIETFTAENNNTIEVKQ